ncbi:MAG: PD-(D/E)XK nuclease family protein [Clostridia bacterium]
MLKFILGTNSSNKAEYLSDKAIELLAQNEQVLVITPEQYTMMWERLILDKKPTNLVNLQILNFNRLYDYAVKYSMQKEEQFIDSTSKKILIFRAFYEVKDSLKVYNKNIGVSFLTKIIEILDEFIDYNISLDEFLEKAKLFSNKATYDKFYDITIILNAYFAILKRSGYKDSNEQTELSEIIKTTGFLKDVNVIFDGFDTFTPLEYQSMYKIISYSKNVFISLCTPSSIDKDGGYGVFSSVKSTYAKLSNAAEKSKVSVSSEVLTDIVYQNDELLYLEQNIFRSDIPYPKKAENIVVYGAKNEYDEASFVAEEISKLIYENKADYRDIVIVGRDTAGFLGILDYMLDKNKIPYFYDRRSEILSKPIVIYLMSLLNMAVYGIDAENLIAYQKSGLTNLTNDEICILENYINRWNIKPSELKSDEPFTKNPNGFAPINDEDTIKELEVLSNLKVCATSSIKEFCEDIKGKSAKEISISIYNFLIKEEIPEKIAKLSNVYLEKSELALAQENKQILNIIIKVLDDMSIAFENETIPIKSYKELFMYILSDVSVGKIPTSLNEVQVGNIDRIRTMTPKYVFVIGLCDGVFPSIVPDNKIITNSERQQLETFGIALSKEYEEQIFVERFYAYKAFSQAKDKIFLSYSKSSQDKESYMSYFLKSVLLLFPNCKLLDFSTRTFADRIYRELSAIEILASNYNLIDEDVVIKILYDYFSEKIGEKYIDKILVNPDFTKDEKVEDSSKISNLYPNDIKISSTKASVYFTCQFKYFCQYVLKLSPQQVMSFDFLQIGTFVHSILEQTLDKAVELKGSISNLTEDEINAISSKACDDYLKENLSSEQSNERFLYIFNRVSKTVAKVITNITDEFSKSKFKTKAVELKIGDDGVSPIKIELASGKKISINGKVDRVDVFEKDNEQYIRVVDYKTGNKDFSFTDINNGQELQLFIYLFSIIENGRKVLGDNLKPAGAIYFPAKLDVIKVARNNNNNNFEISKEHSKKEKIKGLILKNDEVLNAMQTEDDGIYLSKKKSSSKLATDSQFLSLEKHILSLITEMGNGILNGNVTLNPYLFDKSGCDNCDFKSVCGIESGKGNPRKQEKTSEEEFWDKIK